MEFNKNFFVHTPSVEVLKIHVRSPEKNTAVESQVYFIWKEYKFWRSEMWGSVQLLKEGVKNWIDKGKITKAGIQSSFVLFIQFSQLYFL